MRKTIVIGALAVAAFVAGLIYFRHDSGNHSPATMQSAQRNGSGADSTLHAAETPQHAVAGGNTAAEPRRVVSNPLPPDPRLAALAVSQDNGLIEFVRAPDGKVIAEIDKDPNSLGFGKRSREYLYSGDRVIGMTAYRYLPDHVEISRTNVSYKPDGSVDRLAESTSFESGKKK